MLITCDSIFEFSSIKFLEAPLMDDLQHYPLARSTKLQPMVSPMLGLQMDSPLETVTMESCLAEQGV